MKLLRAWTTRCLPALLAAGLLVLAPVAPAAAQGDGDVSDGRVDAQVDDDTASVGAEHETPGTPASSGPSGPNCTQQDGTRAYFRYEGLQYTTMEDQYTDIRPEEQRPGVYLHVYCGDERIGLQFFPDGPEGGVDPETLAHSVTIRPGAPVIRTNPATGRHLVHLEAWFWSETWQGVSETATAGPVSVTVSAQPSSLIVDPGDGSAPFTCAGPQVAYDPGRPATAQSSPCTYTYAKAGHFTATATIVYDVSFTSNVGVGGSLGTIEPDASTAITVHESQGLVTS